MAARQQLGKRIDLIEEAYEFFLAYAAQGLKEEARGSPLTAQLRRYLDGMVAAVGDLGDLLGQLRQQEDLPCAAHLRAFGEVVADDARKAGAALQLVRSQSSVSSQLIDNLNASVHLRALLTDLFVLDEALQLGVAVASEIEAAESSAP